MTQLSSLLKSYSVYISSLIGFLFFSLIILLSVDKGTFIQWIHTQHLPTLNVLFKYWTILGEEIMYAVLTLLFFLFAKKKAAILTPLLGLSVLLISQGLKQFFGVLRPLAWFRKTGIENAINSIPGEPLLVGATSFPSGHTMSAFALYTFIALHFPNRPVIQFLIAIIAIGIGFSRVYLGHHFLSDVFAGGIIGLIIGIAFKLIELKLNQPNNSTTIA